MTSSLPRMAEYRTVCLHSGHSVSGQQCLDTSELKRLDAAGQRAPCPKHSPRELSPSLICSITLAWVSVKIVRRFTCFHFVIGSVLSFNFN